MFYVCYGNYNLNPAEAFFFDHWSDNMMYDWNGIINFVYFVSLTVRLQSFGFSFKRF